MLFDTTSFERKKVCAYDPDSSDCDSGDEMELAAEDGEDGEEVDATSIEEKKKVCAYDPDSSDCDSGDEMELAAEDGEKDERITDEEFEAYVGKFVKGFFLSIISGTVIGACCVFCGLRC